MPSRRLSYGSFNRRKLAITPKPGFLNSAPFLLHKSLEGSRFVEVYEGQFGSSPSQSLYLRFRFRSDWCLTRQEFGFSQGGKVVAALLGP